MGVPGSANFLLAGSQGYRIERSLRFNSADSAYLNRTPASAGNRKTWTFSAWVKRGALGTFQTLFCAGASDSVSPFETRLRFNDTDTLSLTINGNGAIGGSATTSAVFRDPSSWYHIVAYVDMSASGQANKARIYVNGVLQTVSYTNFSTTDDTQVNNNVIHRIAANSFALSGYFNGYLTEINFIDGQALTPSSFGETDTVTGVWKPKKYAGTYGTNGFYLNFSDNSGTTSTTLGKDSSGNGNNWTPNNFSVTAGAGNDSLIDTPTPYADGGNGRGNYATMNPLDKTSTITSANGNLDITLPNGVAGGCGSTFAMSSGKWYWEYVVSTSGTALLAGITLSTYSQIGANDLFSYGYGYYQNGGQKYVNGVVSAYGASYSTTNTIGVALDLDNNTITFYKDNVSQGAISIAAGTYKFTAANGSSSSSPAFSVNFGQRPFAYTPPSGFVALNTQNLPEPSIKKPSSYMDVVTYTGTGSALTPTSSLGFSPDLVWIKGRSGATDHALYDAVRGTEKRLESNNTDAEVTSDGGVTAFNSAGFTLGTLAQVNTSSATYAAWCWDESATPGFDIVTYTGTGSATTVAHSLGVAPSMMIVKRRDSGVGATNWFVYHSRLNNGVNPAQYYLLLQSTNGTAGLSSAWNDTAPTSSVFSVGTSSETNGSGGTFVAYLWSEVAGFSKFGSYTGNGSSDGPFCFCGFRPKYVWLKRTDSAGGWHVHDTARDTANVAKYPLRFQSSSAEDNFDTLDILSNGFKLRYSGVDHNSSGATYIFAAFAEAPFKYALAR